MTLFDPAHDLDADRVVDRLYQGSKPRAGSAVRDAGFGVLVLCAEELQDGPYEGVTTFRCPIDDDEADHPITDLELAKAKAAAASVALYHRAGACVLVTCAAGRNRSGLVTALALHQLFGWSGKKCIEAVRAARGADALSNGSFVKVIEGLR